LRKGIIKEGDNFWKYSKKKFKGENTYPKDPSVPKGGGNLSLHFLAFCLCYRMLGGFLAVLCRKISRWRGGIKQSK